MKYIAILPIDKYNVGDEVPTEKAVVWLSMYKKPHVKLVNGKPSIPQNDVPSNSSDNNMFDDYLARNASVVKKNILEDELSIEQLTELLNLEKSTKNRVSIIEIIEEEIEELKE